MAQTEGLGTGGVDLGAMGQLHGRMPGLHGITTLASDIGPVLAIGAMRRKKAKDYNDQPASHTVGSSNGQVVKDPGQSGNWGEAP